MTPRKALIFRKLPSLQTAAQRNRRHRFYRPPPDENNTCRFERNQCISQSQRNGIHEVSGCRETSRRTNKRTVSQHARRFKVRDKEVPFYQAVDEIKCTLQSTFRRSRHDDSICLKPSSSQGRLRLSLHPTEEREREGARAREKGVFVSWRASLL